MDELQQKAQALRQSLPPERSGTPPAMRGQLLGSLPHKEGQIRIVWDAFEGHSYLSIRLWTGDSDGQLWPSKNGFTVKLRDLPALGEAVGRALDMALEATARSPEGRGSGGQKPSYRSSEGVGAPF